MEITNTSTALAIHNFLPYKRTPLNSKYLGLRNLFDKSKKAAFQDIINKVQIKIEGWRAKILS
jgi:hypothetical protein